MVDKFRKELHSGDIHFRDRWQFELKSEFPQHGKQRQEHIQEFYIFIPNALRITKENYSAHDFFRDQTNFIRFKTPVYSLRELADKEDKNSPLTHLANGDYRQNNKLEYGFKLLGNVVRSSLRERVRIIVDQLDDQAAKKIAGADISQLIEELIKDWHHFRQAYEEVLHQLRKETQDKEFCTALDYVDEFICNSADYYLIGLLHILRADHTGQFTKEEGALCHLIEKEDDYREEYFPSYKKLRQTKESDEAILYRHNLINKFTTDILNLSTERVHFAYKHRNTIGVLAAGFAMLFFLVFYVLGGNYVVVNTEPYIVLTVLLYIIKDRLKEWLRDIPAIRGFSWLSNYTTEIRTAEGKEFLGKVIENFSITDAKGVSEEITRIRNRSFHTLLGAFHRPESVIYYKKKVSLRLPKHKSSSELNIIARFNIERFVAKAANPYQPYLLLDPKDNSIVEMLLPKIYHINIILKSTYIDKAQKQVSELRKYRLIVDKNGIKEVEQL